MWYKSFALALGVNPTCIYGRRGILLRSETSEMCLDAQYSHFRGGVW